LNGFSRSAVTRTGIASRSLVVNSLVDAMPLQSQFNEQKPPGGSHFAGTFHKDAFNAFVLPKPGARRTERQEHKKTTMHPMAMHASSVFYTGVKEAHQPSRLRTQVDKHLDAEAKKPPSIWVQAKATHEAQEAEKAKTAQVAKVEEAPAGPEAVGKTWCPHPSLLRGMCRLNKPRALDWGIDLEAAKGWECPFWEAPRHRFESVANQPEARPVTPTRSLRWRHADDWENPDMHHPYKLTHTIPKTNSMVELSRSRRSVA